MNNKEETNQSTEQRMYFVDFNIEATSKEEALKMFNKKALKCLNDIRDVGVGGL